MGSSGGNASREAEQAEQQRQQQIRNTQGRIESIFSSPEREAEIGQYVDATRSLLQGDLSREKEINDRELKFALARSGQGGSSTAIDQSRNLADAFLRGTLEAERRALRAGNAVRQSDQEAKLGLFNQAVTGLDATTASQNALQSMRQNMALASDQDQLRNFDSFFADFGNIYKASREGKARRDEMEGLGTLFAPKPIAANPIAGGAGFGPPT